LEKKIRLTMEEQALLEEDSAYGLTSAQPSSALSDRPKRPLLGILCALSLSISNGSMLVPIKLSPVEAQGINYIVSFWIGVLGITPIFAFLYFLIFREKPTWNFKVLCLPGLISGIAWNIGNWASIYATIFLGFTIGFPLTQCALLMGGLWGILVFREIRGIKRISVYIVSSIILIGGAVMLGVFGGNP